MPGVDQIVEFLKAHDSLQIGKSPWSTYDQKSQRFRIVWNHLFPAAGRPTRDGPNEWDVFGDEWQPRFSNDFLGALDQALRSDAPTDEEIGQMTRESNWDVCAWYRQFTFWDPTGASLFAKTAS